MKQMFITPLLILVLLPACDPEKASLPTKPGENAATTIKKRKTHKPEPVPIVSDTVPPMTEEAKGTFSPQGLADVFMHVTSLPMPEDTVPLSGTFRVWDENDYAGRKRSLYEATYRANPETSHKLIQDISQAWNKTYSSDSDVKIHQSNWKTHSKDLGLDFTPGTTVMSVHNPYASYTEIGFKVTIDPVNGNMILYSYRGTNDSPREER